MKTAHYKCPVFKTSTDIWGWVMATQCTKEPTHQLLCDKHIQHYDTS